MAQKFLLFPYQEGQTVIMKKNHPCGSRRWTVLRAGADVKLRCQGCARIVDLRRSELEKQTQAVEKGQTKEGEGRLSQSPS